MKTKKSAGKAPAKADKPKAAGAANTEVDPGLETDDQAATPPAGDKSDADANADGQAEAQAETTAETPAGEGDGTAAAPPDAAADAPAPVTVASGVGRYRVVKTGAEIRLANSRAAARVASGELERV
ncbi:hypothetical protein [Maricaulis sp.]|uniref:hypothetical protein n=1 Tax=Maricaulis sp. TaxID=1486257 RepID=UPI0032982690